MAKDNEKIQQIPLDRVLDADIIQWLESIPRSRRNEVLRKILRDHMEGKSGQMTLPLAGSAQPRQSRQRKPREPKRKEPNKKLLGLGSVHK